MSGAKWWPDRGLIEAESAIDSLRGGRWPVSVCQVRLSGL